MENQAEIKQPVKVSGFLHVNPKINLLDAFIVGFGLVMGSFFAILAIFLISLGLFALTGMSLLGILTSGR